MEPTLVNELNTLSDISLFQGSTLTNIHRQIELPINGYKFHLNIGDSLLEEQMSDHALDLLCNDPLCIIGTSIAVHYFDDRKLLRALGLFLGKFSKNLCWMIPDEPYISTCQARGLSPEVIEKRIHHYKGNLESKIRTTEHALRGLSVHSFTVLWDDIRDVPQYRANLSLLQELYVENESFKTDVDTIVTKTLSPDSNKTKDRTTISEVQIFIAKDFLLKELACILAIAANTLRPTIYVYPEPWRVPILEKLVTGSYGILKNDTVAFLGLKGTNGATDVTVIP